jgi:hypothetical protein
MKRTPFRRRRPLRPGTSRLTRAPMPTRRTRVHAVNPERKARLLAEQFGPEAEEIRAMSCVVCGHPPPSHAHHVCSRGAGGKKQDLAPLCAPEIGREGCHQEVHRLGVETFEKLHQVNLAREAARISGARHVALVVRGTPAEITEHYRALEQAEIN